MKINNTNIRTGGRNDPRQNIEHFNDSDKIMLGISSKNQSYI